MDRSPVEKIKERLQIVDVISSYLQVNQAGKNYKAKCPFHNEKTPSFFISPDRGTYYCFGCGAKGDIFSFVQNFEGTDFLGSLKLLAERAGVALQKYRPNKSDEKIGIYHEAMEEATKFFESHLAQNTEAHAYLKSRGLTDQTIKLFRIGYAPASWRSASEYLIQKGFKKEDIEAIGLVKLNEKGFYDRFRSRIMFPINDSSGRTIAFSGRIFGAQQAEGTIEEAKYINSPDTPLYNKSNVLFGIDKAKSDIRKRGYSIVVEGQLDLILSHQASFTNTVAISGTALSDSVSDSESKINNLGLIRRLSPNVIFAFDGDEAGIRASSRSAAIALSLDMQVKVAELPEGEDPADIISKNPDHWRDIIKNSKNIVSFHIDRICKTYADPRIRGRKIREIIFPFLLMVKSSIERSAYIKEIHDKTDLPENSIILDLESFEKANIDTMVEPSEAEEKKKNISRRENLERKFFGILYWQEESKSENEKVKKIIENFKKRINEDVFKKITEEHEPFKDSLAFETEMWYGQKTDMIETDVEELTLNLEEEILKEEKLILQPLDSKEKLKAFDNLSKRIEEIKQNRSSK